VREECYSDRVRHYAWLAPFAWVLGCGNVHSSRPDAALLDGAAIDASPGDDAAIDATPRCDAMAKFGAPTLVTVLGRNGISAGGFRLSSDELSLYFFGSVAGGDNNLYVASRPAVGAAFQNPTLLTLPNSTSNDFDPATSADDRTLWFASTRVTGEGERLYIATRSSPQVEFGQPGRAATVNASDVSKNDFQPFLSADGAELWFVSSRPSTVSADGSNLWHASSTGAAFAPPVEATVLNSAANDRRPVLSADRLTIYWSSDRAEVGAKGGFDIWTAHRNAVGDRFSQLQLVDEVNKTTNDNVSTLSADQCRLYLYSDASGTNEVLVAVRAP
jgi:hypothetical protein